MVARNRGPLALLLCSVIAQAAAAQTWSQLSPTQAPSARNGFVLAHDETTGTALLFGGYDLGALGDTWRWNGSQWQQVVTPVAPTARWSSTMVFDRSRRRFVLFGGFAPGSGMQADTWEFDGLGWTQIATASAPPVRAYAAMAFERDRGCSVLIGGDGGAGQLRNDTWEWDGVAWTERTVAVAPPARAGAVATFDPVRRQTMLFGGAASGQALADTWLWDGAMWLAATPTQSPAPRREAAVAFDVVRDEIVLCGGADATWTNHYGDTWTWDGREWAPSNSGPSARHGAAMVYDAERGAAVLFGGRDGSSFLADTWQRPSVPTTAPFEWTRVAMTGPQPRINAAIAFDAARAQTVVFGGWWLSGPGWLGFGSSSYAAIASGSVWNGSTWTPMPAGPSARSYPAMAYDTARQRTVMFGGRSGAYPMPWTDLAETWEWDGTAWSQLAVVGPSARGEHAMAYDSARGVVVLFGGYTWNTAFHGDTWEFDGVAWTQRSPAVAPSPRSLAAMAFDPIRQRTVLHGGRDGAGGVFGDTWEWNGTTWTQIAGRSPNARQGHSMVFDQGNGSLLLAGAGTGDLWERRGTEWSRLAEPAPVPCSFAAMTYDTVRQRAVLFGGAVLYAENFADASQTVTSYASETWERQPRQPVASATTAYAMTFGEGCGTSSMHLHALAGWRPYVGGSLRAVITRSTPFTYPPPTTWMALGTDAMSVALPLPLDFLGFAGCRLWHTADLALDVGCVATPSGAAFRLDIPSSPVFLGVHVYGQAWGVDWSSFTSGTVAFGNAIDWRIGNW